MNAKPWVAHTQYQYGRMLLRRGKSEDATRADEMINAARDMAQQLGMHGLLSRIEREQGDCQ
jgi:hypothetical protein